MRTSNRTVAILAALALGLAACGGGGGGGGDNPSPGGGGPSFDVTGDWALIRYDYAADTTFDLAPQQVEVHSFTQSGTTFVHRFPNGSQVSGTVSGDTYLETGTSPDFRASFKLDDQDNGSGQHETTRNVGGTIRKQSHRFFLTRMRDPAFPGVGGQWTLTQQSNFSVPAGNEQSDQTATVTLTGSDRDVTLTRGNESYAGKFVGDRMVLAPSPTTAGQSRAIILRLTSAITASGSFYWSQWTSQPGGGHSNYVKGGAALVAARGVAASWFLGPFRGATFWPGVGQRGAWAAQFLVDGAGNGNVNGMQNVDGAVSPVGPLFAYTVTADRVVEWIPGGQVQSTLRGGLSSDGRAAVAGSIRAGAPPEIQVLFLPIGNFTASDFTGSYHYALMTATTGSPSATHWGSASADGVSVLSRATVTTNSGGTLSGPFSATGTNFTVAPDGKVTVDLGQGTMEGTLLRTGGPVILGGSVSNGKRPQIGILLPKATSASLQTFMGEYFAVGMTFNPSDGSHTSFTGIVRADGAGTLDYVSTLENRNGMLTNRSGTDDYRVQSDGTLLTSDIAGVSGGPFRRGAVSRDGRIAFLCGEQQGQLSPIFFVFIRKD